MFSVMVRMKRTGKQVGPDFGPVPEVVKIIIISNVFLIINVVANMGIVVQLMLIVDQDVNQNLEYVIN